MYIVTMQSQKSYVTKTRRVETAAQADTLCTSAKLKAVKVKYDDKHDGINGGLVRSIRMSSATIDFVMTVHKIA
jgi:hypothetical protein